MLLRAGAGRFYERFVRIAIRFIYTGRKSVNEKSRSQLARLFAVKRRAVGFLLDCLC